MANGTPALGVGRKFLFSVGMTLFFLIAPKFGIEIKEEYLDACVKITLGFLGAEGVKDIITAWRTPKA